MAGFMRGFVDECTDKLIYGWAWYPAHPHRRIVVEILVDDVRVAQLTAHEYRPDLKKTGFGDGKYGFKFIPRLPIDTAEHEISIIADGKVIYPRGNTDGRLGLTPDNNYYVLPDLQGRRILEIGCNEGRLARHILQNLNPLDYLGIDVWRTPYQTEALQPRYREGDIERRDTLPFDRQWDVVICFDVLYHLMSPLVGIRNLHDLTGECLVFGSAVIPEGECDSPSYPVEPHTVSGPVLRFAPMYAGDPTNFFYPTVTCMVRMLEWAGFKRIEQQYPYKDPEEVGFFTERASYHCWK
jgi:SAM-dependent methyltransferase